MFSRSSFYLCAVMAISWAALALSAGQWWQYMAAALFTVLSVVTGISSFRTKRP